MTTYEFESVLPVDVDDTLIYWTKIKKAKKVVQYTCPYTNDLKTVGVNQPNVALLKERLARGCLVIVWSKSGHAKAAAVLRALGIDHKNLLVLTKPKDYIDDRPAEQWMGEKIWLDPNCGYGA